jgi:hypothetical protein
VKKAPVIWLAERPSGSDKSSGGSDKIERNPVSSIKIEGILLGLPIDRDLTFYSV